MGVDCFEGLLDLPTDGGGLLLPLPSWGNLCIKPGDDSLLVRMGLVPSISQDNVGDVTTSESEDVEIEVFRNTSVIATEWQETPLQAEDDGFQDISCGDLPLCEPLLDTRTWPSCAFSFSQHLSSIPQVLQWDTSLFASSSSFFGEMLASSSSPDTFDESIPASSDATLSLFQLSFQSPRVTSSSNKVDDSHIRGEQLTDAQEDAQDLNYDISLDSSAMALNLQFSFEADFPLLPSPSDTARFVAEGFALLPDVTLPETEETHSELISQNIKISLDGELCGSSSHPSVSSASISSARSFIMPTFSSMESLIHVSLDIPDFSFGQSFPSDCSLCQLPLCASIDDLVRVDPPAWCEVEDDGDAFEPLPPNTVSPFYLPSRSDLFKDCMDSKHTSPSLPTIKEEGP